MQPIMNAKELHELFTAGYRNLKKNMETINNLNVFPVPDGDTGANMVMTFGRQADWTIDGDGVVELAEGISQKCHSLTIGGRTMPKGKYGSASAPGVPPENVSAHFDGLGVLNVVGDGYGATFTIR